MAEAQVYSLAGEALETVQLPDRVFGVPLNEAVVHQAVVRQLADRRQGTHDTKTRGEVEGGGAKPWRQKGTGRARQGSTRAPQWRKGGAVFGPHPRSYRQEMPVKMRRLAVRCVLSDKAANNALKVIEDFNLDEPKTKLAASLLRSIGVGRSALVLLHESNANAWKSLRNLPRVKVMRAQQVNVLDMLNHESLVVTRDGLKIVEELLGK